MSHFDSLQFNGLKAFLGKSGALETWRFFKLGPDSNAEQYIVNAIAMLGPDGSTAEIEVLADQYFERNESFPEAILAYCVECTGALPDPSDDADASASKSFALLVFILAGRLLRPENISDENKAMANYMRGRISEWWRWRGPGLDTLARVRKAAVASLLGDSNNGRRTVNAKRKADAAIWQSQACSIAAEIWERSPGLSALAMAPLVKKELARRGFDSANQSTPGIDRIRRVIALVRPK
jgi:hypothetical protein